MRAHRTLLILISAVAPAAAAADSDPVVVWSRNGSVSPMSATWNGTSWSTPVSTCSVGAEAKWIVSHGCPSRNEIAFACLDSNKDINVAIRSGSSWSIATEVCTDSGQSVDRAFDLAYSSLSGQLLVAYWKQSTKTLGYVTSTGSSVSPESTLALPGDKKLRYIRLVPKPGSDEIVFIGLDDSNDIWAATWSGSSFGSITSIETNAKTDGNECISLAFESESGAGLLVYGEKSQNSVRYRTYISGSWSSEFTGPDVGSPQVWLKLAAEPGSDRIVLVSLDDAKDLNACIWNGASWGSVTELQTDAAYKDRRIFDLAFPSSGSGLVAYGKKNQTAIYYRTLSGSTWSAEQAGPDLGDAIMFVQVAPAAAAGELFVLAADGGEDLSLMRWSGSSLTLGSTIEGALGGDNKTEAFMLATPGGTGTRRRIIQWRQVAPD